MYLYMSKARTGLYDKSKASGGIYLYEPPTSPVASLLLFKALVETLDRPKSASYEEKRDTYVNSVSSIFYVQL